MTRTVAITGAASGIGQAAARRLLGESWTVFGLDAARYVTGTTTPVDGGTQAAFVPAGSR